MDSPCSSLNFPPAVSDPRADTGGAVVTATSPAEVSRCDVVLVADLGNAVAADFAAFTSQDSRCDVVLLAGQEPRALSQGKIRPISRYEWSRLISDDRDGLGRPRSLMLFLGPRLAEPERRRLADLLRAASQWPVEFVGIISTFRVHLGDIDAEEAEHHALTTVRACGLKCRTAVLRPGYVLCRHSGVSRWLSRLAPWFPLVPRRLRTCFIEGEDLFAAIEAERFGGDRRTEPRVDRTRERALSRRERAYALLGPNLPWRDVLSRHQIDSRAQRAATVIAKFLSWLLVGQLIGLVVVLAARKIRLAKPWLVHTLKPRSIRELVSLCHRANIDHVRVVGYNNGVNHFGHRHAGKTIVSTVRCGRTAHAGPGKLKADCGATIRAARDYLAGRGEELYVCPNYSYVSVGTAYFVPIHGSAVDYSTVADTAFRVILYDPDRDRIISAERHDNAFKENIYNLRSRVVVLRLYLLTTPKSRYYVDSETWRSPEASTVLEALRDRDAANVEIRQSHAASSKVMVSRYYTTPGGRSAPTLESPRDALGRLWDRLEENPLTSFLMHALSRHVAWHTELFLSPREFELFWRTRAQVPLRKIQLRYIRRDGMPHSPFCHDDSVSADLFLFRYDKPAFDAYVKQVFTTVRTNPGKHSN
jgi:hypothetical protein